MERLNENKSDEEVLALSVKNPSAFGELVERYEKPFIRKAESIIGKREEAYDIVQDTFTKIYLNANRFKVQEGAKFSSWAYKILINTSLTYYNKLKKERENTVALDTEIMENLEGEGRGEVEGVVFQREVLVVVSKLPRHLSRVIKMYFIDGYSQKEIAKLEGISVGAVKTRVHRAKKELKRSALNGELTL